MKYMSEEPVKNLPNMYNSFKGGLAQSFIN